VLKREIFLTLEKNISTKILAGRVLNTESTIITVGDLN